MGPKEFEGSIDPLDVIEWLNSICSIFDCLKFNDEDRIGYAVCMLRKDARYWWETTKQGNELHCSTWFGFEIEFHRRYCNQIAMKALENKFSHSHKEGDQLLILSWSWKDWLKFSQILYLLRRRKWIECWDFLDLKSLWLFKV